MCYGSGQQISHILDSLVANGCAPDTPAAIVVDGTLPTQKTYQGTVASLLQDAPARPRREALLIVGRVVAFREHLRWFDQRPLFGRRVVITRPREQAVELVDRLAAFGAEPIEAPMIRIVPAEDPGPLEDAAAHASEFDWIVFTSANAVDAFMRALFEGELDVRALKGPRLCAVGSATAERLSSYRLRVDLVPHEFRSEAAFEALNRLGPLDGVRVLLPRADIGREVLAEDLRTAGAIVTEVIAYRTIVDEGQRDGDPDIYGMLLERRIDAVTFTSASAVRNFAQVYGVEQSADLLRHTVVAAIGPVTAEAATNLGIRVTVQPATYTVPALVDALAAHFTQAAAKA
jgi:uroporphyrinogen III methyltransferase/synthase